jgi:hypothetical protein
MLQSLIDKAHHKVRLAVLWVVQYKSYNWRPITRESKNDLSSLNELPAKFYTPSVSNLEVV